MSFSIAILLALIGGYLVTPQPFIGYPLLLLSLVLCFQKW